MAITAYVIRLVIIYRGDFEAGGRSGTTEFILKAKERTAVAERR